MNTPKNLLASPIVLVQSTPDLTHFGIKKLSK